MIDFSRQRILGFAAHYVGNFGLGEDLDLSEEQFIFKEEKVKDVFFNYLLSGFKNDIYYHFSKKSDLLIYDVKSSVERMFKNNYDFFDATKDIAKHLYQQTTHLKVKGGEFYVAYIKDVVIDGELCDAVGIFKSESKETFIKVDFTSNQLTIETDTGVVSKLEKGVLIFNVDKENGYKAVIIDNSSKIADAATYWSKDFLDMELKESPYLNTVNCIEQCVTFCDEILTEENNVKKSDKMMMLNNSVNYFDKNIEFVQEEFEKEVLVDEELIKHFREHQEKHMATYNTSKADKFPISKTAVKKYNKLSKSVINLDDNFDINIRNGHNLMENGYDEEKGMKFYKLYYTNED